MKKQILNDNKIQTYILSKYKQNFAIYILVALTQFYVLNCNRMFQRNVKKKIANFCTDCLHVIILNIWE